MLSRARLGRVEFSVFKIFGANKEWSWQAQVVPGRTGKGWAGRAGPGRAEQGHTGSVRAG